MTSNTTDQLSGPVPSAAIKVPCVTVTTANITLEGEQTINSVAVVDGDRVLVKDQTDATENGIYIAAEGAWTRAKDFDGSNDVRQGTLVKVANGGLYELVSPDPVDFDTDDIDFEQSFSSDDLSAQSITALLLADSALSAAIADNSITDAKLRQSAGVSLIGRSANTSGNVADISAASDNLIVGRLSGAIAFDSVSAFLDAAIGSTQGQIIYRGASTWDALATGTAGYVLQTNGAAANPSWVPTTTTTAAILQCLQTTYATNTSLTTNIPYDNTTPTSTEGTQVLSQAITPADNTNKVLVMAVVNGGTSGASPPATLTMAVFRGSTCIDVKTQETATTSKENVLLTSIFLDSPASASSTTYSVRVGSDTDSAFLNGNGAASRKFGGTAVCTLTVMEVNA